jgi:hypothetical protein
MARPFVYAASRSAWVDLLRPRLATQKSSSSSVLGSLLLLRVSFRRIARSSECIGQIISTSQYSPLARIVTVAEVCYLRADNKYTTVATRNASFLLNSTLKQMKEKLDPALSWQIHRSIIVNVSAIDAIYRSFRGSLEVKLKERSEILPVSHANAYLFKPP